MAWRQHSSRAAFPFRLTSLLSILVITVLIARISVVGRKNSTKPPIAQGKSRLLRPRGRIVVASSGETGSAETPCRPATTPRRARRCSVVSLSHRPTSVLERVRRSLRAEDFPVVQRTGPSRGRRPRRQPGGPVQAGGRAAAIPLRPARVFDGGSDSCAPRARTTQ